MSESSLLLFDIGNTSMKVGISCHGKRDSYTLATGAARTSDDLGLNLLSIFAHSGTDAKEIDACVVTSVVPGMNPLLRKAIARYLGCPVFFVPGDIPIPMENRYLRPQEVGADRLVGAYAARMFYPDFPSLIIVDFGTAVTFDCVTDGAYQGGLIFPGPQTALAALAGQTAKLPHVSLDVEGDTLLPGRDTATSIRHGIYFGFVSMVEGLVSRLSRNMTGPVGCIGTGGFASAIGKVCSSFDEIRPGLLLEGLELIFQSQQS